MGNYKEGDFVPADDYFLDYQDAWINDNSPAKLWDKSRRIGATYAESYRACSIRNKIDYVRHYYFSSADESAAFEYAQYCQMWCKLIDAAVKRILEELEDDKGRKYNNYITEFPNGCRINCMTSNPKRFRSKGGDVVLDEYDWHDSPKEMYDAASPATTWGYDIAMLTTRSAEGTHFDALANLCKKVAAGLTTFDAEQQLEWSYHHITIIKAIQQGLAEKIFKLNQVSFEARYKLFKQCRARSRDADAFGREYLCVPSAEASTLIPYDIYQSCVMENCLQDLVHHTKERRFYYLGGDIGRHAHLTTFYIQEDVAGILIPRKIISLLKTPYNVQQQVLNDLLENQNIIRGCIDATGKGEMLAEEAARKFGEYRIEQLTFTNPLKDHLATQILNRFEDKRIRVPNDPKVREAFHKIKKTITAAGHIRYDATADEAGHADEFWAAALSCEAAGTNVIPQVFVSVA